MQETTEEVKEVSWDTVGADSGKFFSPEKDRAYTITLASAKLVEDPKWKDKEGKPKKKVIFVLATIDGKPTALEWGTGSWDIIRAIKKCVQDKSVERSVFLLKKKEEQGKTTYVFEKTGEKSPSSSDIPFLS